VSNILLSSQCFLTTSGERSPGSFEWMLRPYASSTTASLRVASMASTQQTIVEAVVPGDSASAAMEWNVDRYSNSKDMKGICTATRGEWSQTQSRLGRRGTQTRKRVQSRIRVRGVFQGCDNGIGCSEDFHMEALVLASEREDDTAHTPLGRHKHVEYPASPCFARFLLQPWRRSLVRADDRRRPGHPKRTRAVELGNFPVRIRSR
jgi:hypothetical protein